MAAPTAKPIVTKLGQQTLHIAYLKVITPHLRFEAVLRQKSRSNVTFTACSVSRYLWQEEGRRSVGMDTEPGNPASQTAAQPVN